MVERTDLAERLAAWAVEYEPTTDDQILAGGALVDTVAVAAAGRGEPVTRMTRAEAAAVRWATAAHALDYDDLHMASTTHISAVCVPATLSVGGTVRAYLAGAGVMARLGVALGWSHYGRGWHATCCAGAPAAAVAAGTGLGLDAAGLATAMALAIPAAGGLQRAFGTMAKPLQVGFATEAGVRAARLAAAGASANWRVLDDWVGLVGGRHLGEIPSTPAIPGGLGVKGYPCCYALQRPIAAVAEMALDPDSVRHVRCRTPQASLAPLIHHRPMTGLEGKFSLEYGVAAAILDRSAGIESFTDAAVARPEARRLMTLVEIEPLPGGANLLDGAFEAEVALTGGQRCDITLEFPPGAPSRPFTQHRLGTKVRDCAAEWAEQIIGASWEGAGDLLASVLGERDLR